MKSFLIKDTTKQERIELIREWLPVDDGLEDCEIDLWDMYDYSPMSRPSRPTTETSSGTRLPASRRARMAPMAITSDMANRAVNSRPRASRFFTAR